MTHISINKGGRFTASIKMNNATNECEVRFFDNCMESFYYMLTTAREGVQRVHGLAILAVSEALAAGHPIMDDYDTKEDLY